MTGQSTMLTMAAATAGAAVVGGPLSQVLNELAAVMAIMGAAGGLTWGLANRYPWRDWVRGIILGALMAFGFGLASPSILQGWIGISFAPGGTSASWLASCAFVMGMMQDWVLAFVRRGQVSK
jgi:hypothetical protein